MKKQAANGSEEQGTPYGTEPKAVSDTRHKIHVLPFRLELTTADKKDGRVLPRPRLSVSPGKFGPIGSSQPLSMPRGKIYSCKGTAERGQKIQLVSRHQQFALA